MNSCDSVDGRSLQTATRLFVRLQGVWKTLILTSVVFLQFAEPLASQERVSVLDGVYTEEQAARGERLNEAVCMTCHEQAEFIGPYFQSKWDGRPVRGLYVLLRTTMPAGNPNSLTPQQYSDLIAYILWRNGYPAGEKELSGSPGQLSGVEFRALPECG